MVAMTRFHGLLRRAVKSCYLLHKISLQPLRGTKPYHPVFPAHFDLRICYLPPYYLLTFLCQPRPVYSTAVSYYYSRVRQDLNLHTASATSANLLCQLSYVLVFRLSPDHFVLWTFASISSAKIISSTSPTCFINTIKKSPLSAKRKPLAFARGSLPHSISIDYLENAHFVDPIITEFFVVVFHALHRSGYLDVDISFIVPCALNKLQNCSVVGCKERPESVSRIATVIYIYLYLLQIYLHKATAIWPEPSITW